MDLVACMGEKRNAYKAVVGKPEGKIPLVRPSARWEDNVETDLKRIGREVVYWIRLVQDSDQVCALVNMVILGSIKHWESGD
jgi:hypothetical protein